MLLREEFFSFFFVVKVILMNADTRVSLSDRLPTACGAVGIKKPIKSKKNAEKKANKFGAVL